MLADAHVMSSPQQTGQNVQGVLSLLRMPWDHAPRPGGCWCAGVLDCGSPLPLLRPRTSAESASGLAHSNTWQYGARFIESLLWLARVHRDNEPTPDPSQEGSRHSSASCPFPSWAGSGVGRFMERGSLVLSFPSPRDEEVGRREVPVNTARR